MGVAAVCALAAGILPVHAKPPLPTVLLYPASASDMPATADIRTRLRIDGVFQVLTYDSESATVQRIAAETSHPEWLVGGGLSDDARLALARALNVAFYIVVSPGREPDSTHLQMVETVPPALTYDWRGQNRQFGARAVESQAQASMAHQAADTNVVTPSITITEPAPAVKPSPALPIVIIAVPRIQPAPIVTVLAPAPVVKPAPLPPTIPIVVVAVAPIQAAPIPAPTVKPPPVPEIAAPVAPVAEPALPIVVVPVPVVKPPHVPEVITLPIPPAVVDPKPELVIEAPPSLPKPPVSPAPGPMMALLPSNTLMPDPAPEVQLPPIVSAHRIKTEDLAAIMPLLNKGDAALDSGDVVGAISFYRQAINGAPLSVVPRLKLAEAYEKGGLTDKALDEAKRALEISPDSLPIQQFLTEIDNQNGTSDGSTTRYRAMVERDPKDSAAHSGLAEALWNGGDLQGAEVEYKAAKKFAAQDDHSADAHLAQLYATLARYDDCLASLQEAGKNGYALAIKIVRSRADTLSSMIEASRDSFAAGKSTREQFYDGSKKVSTQAQALADFVSKITPPADYKLSHLHRRLSTNLLAQEAAALVTSIETSDASQTESVATLDKEAQTEMLTAQATEEKLGLWEVKK